MPGEVDIGTAGVLNLIGSYRDRQRFLGHRPGLFGTAGLPVRVTHVVERVGQQCRVVEPSSRRYGPLAQKGRRIEAAGEPVELGLVAPREGQLRSVIGVGQHLDRLTGTLLSLGTVTAPPTQSRQPTQRHTELAWAA